MTFLFAQSLASLFIFPSICNISKAVTIPNGHTIPHCYEVFVTHIIDVFSLSLFQVNLITSLSSLVLGVFAVTSIIHNVAFLFLPIIQLYFTLPHWNPQNWNVFFLVSENPIRNRPRYQMDECEKKQNIENTMKSNNWPLGMILYVQYIFFPGARFYHISKRSKSIDFLCLKSTFLFISLETEWKMAK